MGRWQKNTEHWLSNEEQGLDDAADAAFQQVFSALSPVEPSSSFVQRAVEAAWRARTRQRRIFLVAAVAASLFVVLTASAAAYGVFGIAGGWLLTTGAAIATNSAVSIIAAATTAVEWWFATARAGSALAGIMATPQSVVVLFTIELVGIVALYMLQRLLRAEVGFRGPGALCF
jgi:hypothetical protein